MRRVDTRSQARYAMDCESARLRPPGRRRDNIWTTHLQQGETRMKKIAATLVLMLGTTFAFSQWEVVTELDEKTDTNITYISNRSTNQISLGSGSGRVHLWVFCEEDVSGHNPAFLVISRGAFRRSFLGNQTTDIRFDDDSAVSEVWSVDERLMWLPFSGDFLEELASHNRLRVWVDVERSGEQIARFDIRGYSAAFSQCP